MGKGDEAVTDSLISRAESIVCNASVATIARVDSSGYPSASTISSIRSEGVGVVWFATGLKSRKAQAFRLNHKASVCYREGGSNITLVGTIEIVTEPELKRELWLDWFIDHFPGGITDPNYCLLRFTAHRACFWIDGQYEEIVL